MTKKTSKAIAARARRLIRAREEGRNGYALADRLLKEIREKGMKPGDKVVINSAGDKVVLRDLYAESDKVFRAHGIGRFELEIVKASAA